MTADILIVDDEEDIRNLIQGILEDEGYKTRPASGASTAFAQIKKKVPDLIVLDIWLQGSEKDGLGILKSVKQDHPHLPVLMISGHGTIETAVAAIKDGAYDFIEKPFKSDRLLTMMVRALEASALKRENQSLREKADVPADITGDSHAAAQVMGAIEKVAAAASRVLITGESGTGKETAARIIHKKSPRAKGPFVVLNCARLRPEQIEEEIFGSEKGALIAGVLEQANGGTLLLDEVADMPLETQGKILRALQDQTFVRVGGNAPVKVDVRILSTTSRNLEHEIKCGNFREDLFYRLNVVPVHMPALKERVQDIPALTSVFAAQYAALRGQKPRIFSAAAMTALQSYGWPGNVRQLKNTVEWSMIMHPGESGEMIDAAHLPPDITGRAVASSGQVEPGDYLSLPLREAREAFETKYLQAQMIRFEGSVSETARFIGMERSALHRKLKTLGINGSDKEEDDSVSVLKRA